MSDNAEESSSAAVEIPPLQATEDERQGALALKRAAEEQFFHDHPEAIPSDYECVQHWIVAKGNHAEASKRVELLHYFRQEHGISTSQDDEYDEQQVEQDHNEVMGESQDETQTMEMMRDTAEESAGGERYGNRGDAHAA